ETTPMPFDPNAANVTVGVVGTGSMGRGIMQVAAQGGLRVIAYIGCGVAQRAIAIPADIDKGTKLGLGYPFGPLEWGDRLGAGRVLHILERLHAFYGEPRYRPSPWLKRRVALGLPLSAPEGRAPSA